MPPYEIRDTHDAMRGPKGRRGPPKDALVIAVIGLALVLISARPIFTAFEANDFAALLTSLFGWGLLGVVGLGLLFVARRRWVRP